MESSKRTTETKRATIIYFLNRSGRIEQPHLLHHLHNSSLHLRDVKKWMSDLRGKDMPESFSWSYQRRYKKRFVWQDLKDDDLITPITDSEYVLLGSLIPEERFSRENERNNVEKEEHRRSSPERGGGRRRYRRKTSHVIRSFLTCKAVDTVESVQFAGKNGAVNGGLKKSVRTPLRLKNSIDDNNERETEPAGGGKSSRKAGRTRVPMPKCSQCGKSFKPEKLHSHMKSCIRLNRSQQ